MININCFNGYITRDSDGKLKLWVFKGDYVRDALQKTDQSWVAKTEYYLTEKSIYSYDTFYDFVKWSDEDPTPIKLTETIEIPDSVLQKLV